MTPSNDMKYMESFCIQNKAAYILACSGLTCYWGRRHNKKTVAKSTPAQAPGHAVLSLTP